MEQSSKEHLEQHSKSKKIHRTCTDNTRGGTAMPADLGWDALKGLSCAETEVMQQEVNETPKGWG